ncbi:uncharacterized protein LOC126672227 [Mercurialis annua]|uniref:uncharacterized protein LOC126672227 n=1 Tax=Mercurialis annua TaxID=3986 RepID=UPI00215E1338|nr:uncharacterized protein LOC126672227 [Mercurialis annua]
MTCQNFYQTGHNEKFCSATSVANRAPTTVDRASTTTDPAPVPPKQTQTTVRQPPLSRPPSRMPKLPVVGGKGLLETAPVTMNQHQADANVRASAEVQQSNAKRNAEMQQCNGTDRYTRHYTRFTKRNPAYQQATQPHVYGGSKKLWKPPGFAAYPPNRYGVWEDSITSNIILHPMTRDEAILPYINRKRVENEPEPLFMTEKKEDF